MAELEAETIRGALSLARRHGFDEVELRAGETLFAGTLLTRKGASSPPALIPETSSRDAVEVRSHSVGYAHLAGLAPGDAVKEGARLATIETLGIANDLLAPRGGILKEFLVENESPVEFGQIVAILEALS